MKAKEWVKNSRLGRGLVRLLGEEKGAVAMEYIVIALLIGAAVVALVMVFGGNIRNMFAKSNDVMTSTTVDEVKTAGEEWRKAQEKMKEKKNTAEVAGDKLGGDFNDAHGSSSGGGTGGGGNP